MPRRRVASLLLCALALVGCAHWSAAIPDQPRIEREMRTLLEQPTPERLATASILAFWIKAPAQSDRPMKLIEQAEALAPQRPELVWMQLSHCLRTCDARVQIEDRLTQLDPDNGFVWLADLERAQASGSEAAITAAIVRIGGASRMTFYWNELAVLLTDGLAVAEPTQGLSNRATRAYGLLAAMVIPPLQPMSKACRTDQFAVPGRRAACEVMFARMEHSAAVLTQSLALSVQQRWWPAGSPQRDALAARHRRLDYLLAISSRIRWWRMDRDMAVRLDAARRTGSEEDVELALARSFGLPTDPPADWKDPMNRS
jgi:hypothetical protein